MGGFGLHAQWSDDFHHALHAALTGERAGYYADFGGLADVAKALKQAYVYDGCYSRFRQRRHGRPIGGLSGHRFVSFLQNHDQVGNRARGERSNHLMSVGCAKIGAALVFMSPFVPMLFQGEEWGASSPFQYFTDHDDPELGAAVTHGRREEFAAFGWAHDEIPDPQSVETFVRSKLNWDEIGQAAHADLLAWHRSLIALRRSHAAISNGRLEDVTVRYDEAARWLVFERGPISVACNLSSHRLSIPLRAAARWTMLLSSAEDARLENEAIALAPESVAVLSADATGSL